MKKILVIEDDQLVRATIVDLLEAEGFQLISASDGKKGVVIATEQHPDLIICDIMMPEMSGYDVINSLHQNTPAATTPFIFLSALGEKGAVRRGMELGADDYLTKPFTCDELLNAINSRLARQEALSGRYSEELKQKNDELNYLTHYDPLTGLPNQTLFHELFKQILLSQVIPDACLPVLALTLDRFEWIHNSVGQSHSEILIKTIAERIKTRLDGSAIIARWQPDQFMIIPGFFKTKQSVIEVVEELQAVLAEPFIFGVNEFSVTASIGIAIYPDDSSTIETLVRNASTVVYQIGKAGGNGYQFYESKIHTKAFEQLYLETALRHGLERGEFEIYYQPQVDLESNQITGAEALVRWRHPQKGMISPAQFIPMAEETGLIIPLGEWVLRQACEQIKAWQMAGLPHLRVAVNLAARQFSQRGLVELIAQILTETKLDPDYLELELTESTLVKDVPTTILLLKELKALGITIALDDFGTGYSSLSYLRQFPFDVLKIDQCFVRNMIGVAKNQLIIESTIQLAHKLNLKVVAEGVETYDELEFLAGQNCDLIQGYLFSRPVPAPEFEKLLASGYCLASVANSN